ncbi:hypothetical protein [Luteolibacter sp. LG18]|uniref:hypothetical protein n=1 Tax=Luteolibacter sp. LG18 TaxID=2819286 RepID=UPI002B2F13C8|nr:hypothetical protein llg_32370 [Luteolibacter sp. LG18]
MFKRITHEDWAAIIPILSFACLFTVFLLTTLRALRMKPEERDRLAALANDTTQLPQTPDHE